MRMGPLLDPATFLRDAPETQVEEDTPLTKVMALFPLPTG